MHRKENFLPFFITFFCISIFIILLGRLGIAGSIISLINKSASPLKTSTIGILSLGSLKDTRITQLMEENAQLRKKDAKDAEIIAENKALSDQFQKSKLPTQSLLPVKVVGYPSFIPGVSLPQYLVVEGGDSQGIKIGDSAVVGNYLVGKIISVSGDFSKIELVNSTHSSFTAKISADVNETTGIIKGNGSGEMILDNVLLTKTIISGADVLTKGDKNEKGEGYPPGLVVGKIISVEKKPSDLFQKAAVKSYLDFPSLTTVFVIK